MSIVFYKITIKYLLCLHIYRGSRHTSLMTERLHQRHIFTRQRQQGQLALALVGMSNVGKSLWAGRLAESGFAVYGCDDEIERRLAPELQAAGYTGGLADVARWMGQPYDPQFAATQARYLTLEGESLARALEQTTNGNRVIDTTGSVIHLDTELLKTLREQTTVVHLAANADMQAEMYQQYLTHPKPVVWGDSYQPLNGELPEAALKRLYPALLARRNHSYGQLAHATITREQLLRMDSTQVFLDAIEQSLGE